MSGDLKVLRDVVDTLVTAHDKMEQAVKTNDQDKILEAVIVVNGTLNRAAKLVGNPLRFPDEAAMRTAYDADHD